MACTPGIVKKINYAIIPVNYQFNYTFRLISLAILNHKLIANPNFI